MDSDWFGYSKYLTIKNNNPDLGLPPLTVQKFTEVFRAFPDEVALLKSRQDDDPANRDLLIRVFGAKPMEGANENSIQIPDCPVKILREIIFY